MKIMYRIKDEYLDMWGAVRNESDHVDSAEIARLAAEWETSVNELMDQVEEI